MQLLYFITTVTSQVHSAGHGGVQCSTKRLVHSAIGYLSFVTIFAKQNWLERIVVWLRAHARSPPSTPRLRNICDTEYVVKFFGELKSRKWYFNQRFLDFVLKL